MKEKGNASLIFLLAVVIASIGIIGGSAYIKNKMDREKSINKSVIPYEAISPTLTASPTAKPTATKSADLKTQQSTVLENTPMLCGALFKYKVIGSQSSEVEFDKQVKYQNSYFDYDGSTSQHKLEGFMYFEPHSSEPGEDVKTYITAVSEDGKRSDTFILSDNEWKDKLSKFYQQKKETQTKCTAEDFVMEHTFIFK